MNTIKIYALLAIVAFSVSTGICVGVLMEMSADVLTISALIISCIFIGFAAAVGGIE